VTTNEIFLIAMTVILAVPYAVWRLGRTDYVAPLVVVQIVTGIVLGPGILGAVFPEAYRFVFNPQVVQALGGIACWAVMLFVWLAGLELDFRLAWQNRTDISVTAACALVLPWTLGAAAGALLLAWQPGWLGSAAEPWQFVAGIGMSCSVTALPILVILLEKLGILRTPLGQRVLGYASLDDIAVWGMLAMILMDWTRLGRQFAFLLGFVMAALALRRAMRAMPETDRWYVALVWLAVCGLSADWAGLHYMVGAFLAGAVLDSQWFEQRNRDLLRHHLLLTVMPVFFLSTGLRTSWGMGGASVFLAAALFLAAAVAGKLAGVRVAGRLLGWTPGEATVIGWLLQTKALIMIVFANVLLDKAIISSTTFTALLLMAVASTMLTVPVVAPRLRAARGPD
jgi:Kef-type K+ transport system membrane component KefB